MNYSPISHMNFDYEMKTINRTSYNIDIEFTKSGTVITLRNLSNKDQVPYMYEAFLSNNSELLENFKNYNLSQLNVKERTSQLISVLDTSISDIIVNDESINIIFNIYSDKTCKDKKKYFFQIFRIKDINLICNRLVKISDLFREDLKQVNHSNNNDRLLNKISFLEKENKKLEQELDFERNLVKIKKQEYADLENENSELEFKLLESDKKINEVEEKNEIMCKVNALLTKDYENLKNSEQKNKAENDKMQNLQHNKIPCQQKLPNCQNITNMSYMQNIPNLFNNNMGNINALNNLNNLNYFNILNNTINRIDNNLVNNLKGNKNFIGLPQNNQQMLPYHFLFNYYFYSRMQMQTKENRNMVNQKSKLSK